MGEHLDHGGYNSTAHDNVVVPSIVIEPHHDHEANVLDAFRHAIIQFLSFLLFIGLEDLNTQLFVKIRNGNKGQDFILHTYALSPFGDPESLAEKVISHELNPGCGDHISGVRRHKDYLVFTCHTQKLVKDTLLDIYNSPSYGFHDIGAKHKIIVEYSSPNIAKPFHVGHLRPTIIGAFTSELYKRFGWLVNAVNYLGDWGTQFGMIAVGFDKYGSEDMLQLDPCHHLYEVYVKISGDAESDPSIKVAAAEHFKKLELGDEQALAVWKQWRELSIRRYKEDYALLNAKFDTYTSEHDVRSEWQKHTTSLLETNDLLVDDFGTKRVKLDQYGLGAPVYTKRNGTSIYLSRDIAEAQQRQEDHGFDKMIYVVASQQDVHLNRVFKTLELMGVEWADKLQHINHGMVLGMKTRKGAVIFLDETIQQIKETMLDKLSLDGDDDHRSRVATELAVTALKVQDLSAKRIKNYTFTPGRIEGCNGVYLQFTYARLAGIRRRNERLLRDLDVHHIDLSCLDSPDVHHLVFLLATYPEVTVRTYQTHQPCTIVKFCFSVCRAVMRVYETTRVHGEPDLARAQARLLLFECTRQLLHSAMTLLTLRPLEHL
ncbi:hypothetical protein HGRIS_004559 [Hohenbuehelia grisea]|uniref:arginine--tRNA ligase n=1 Tax=Hohenbuehelia grisea TaxID=104357 RepID=A0ABR3JC82_9AGAR